jgi:hypothetical protein
MFTICSSSMESVTKNLELIMLPLRETERERERLSEHTLSFDSTNQ